MAMEIYVISDNKLTAISTWQRAIDLEGFDLQLSTLALLQHPFASGLIYGQGCEVRERFTRRAAVAGARRPRSMEGVRRGDCWARD